MGLLSGNSTRRTRNAWRDDAGDGAIDCGDEAVEAEMLEILLEGDWSDKQWQAWMGSRFGEGYYKIWSYKVKKPKFDYDIDITDIVPDSRDRVIHRWGTVATEPHHSRFA